MMDWGYICVIISILMAVTQAYVAYQLPGLDAQYAWLIFKTHHYIEMPGALLFGIGLSRIYQQKQIKKIGDIIVWTTYIIVTIYQVITKPYPIIITISATTIVYAPFPIGFYAYKIYQNIKGSTQRKSKNQD